MAIDETAIRLLIEADDRTQKTFDEAKKRVDDLQKAQSEANTKIAASQTRLADGQSKVNIKTSEFLALVKKSDDATKGLVAATKEHDKALAQLEKSHAKLAQAQQQFANQSTTAYQRAGEAVGAYVGRFVGVAAVIELVHRSIKTHAEFERSLAHVGFETQKSGYQLDALGERFVALAGKTGESAEELMGKLRVFRDQMGDSGEDVVKAFEEITSAANVMGVSVGTLAQSVTSTLKQLQIPVSETRAVLDVWVGKIPASMMDNWLAASGAILGSLRDIGYQGPEAAKKIASEWGAAAGVLGSAEKATSLFVKSQQAATDIGTLVGRVLLPEAEKRIKAGEGELAINKLLYEQLEELGVFSEDLETKQIARAQHRGKMSDDDLRAMEDLYKAQVRWKQQSDLTGESIDSIRAREAVFHKGTQEHINELNQAFKELQAAIGSAFGTKLISDFARDLRNLKKEIEWYVRYFKTGQKDTGASGSWEAPTPPAVGPGLTPPAPQAPPSSQGRPRSWGRLGGATGGFALGGSFQVGGQGGSAVDTEPVGFMAKPGERVDVTTPMQESLQAQQDKADIAMREHFARFHQTAFTKTGAAPWWPGGSVREPGADQPGRGGEGRDPAGGGGRGRDGGGTSGGRGSSGGNNTGSTGSSGDSGTGSALKAPTNLDPSSDTGPAENIDDAIKRGYLQPAAAVPSGASSAYLAQQRAHLFAALDKDPALKKQLSGLLMEENHDPAGRSAVLESMANRAILEGKSLRQVMNDRDKNGKTFYGPINTGAVDRNIQSGAADKNMPATDAAIAKVRGGSDDIEMRTDQGQYDPARGINEHKDRTGIKQFKIGKTDNGEYYSYHNEKWSRDQLAKKAAFDAANAPGDKSPSGPVAATPIANIAAAVKAGQTIDKDGNVKEASGELGKAGEGEVKLQGSTAGIRPELAAVIKEASKSLPEGYTARVLSGKEARARGGEHPKGNAGDVKIYGPDGKPVGGDQGWYQNAATFRLYEQFAQRAKTAQEKMYPGANFTWGGYFVNNYSGKGKMPYGTADLMHMQWGGPMAGGTWQGGASGPIKEWLEREGGTSVGMNGKVAVQGQRNVQVTSATTPEAKAKEAAAMKDLEERAAKRYREAEERNKPAAAPTNTRSATDGPADGGKKEEKAAGKTPAAVAAHSANTGKAAGKSASAVAAHNAATANKPEGQGGIGSRQWGGEVRSGRPYVVGESGPEMFTPAGPGQITPGVGDIGGMMGQYREFTEMLRQPITPNLQMPRAGPIRQRMSRHVEAQRERDVGRMQRHASHSDIGFV